MNSQQESIDIESITFQQSPLLEQMIVSIGTTLHHTLMQTQRYDETVAVSELIGEFTLLASVYGEQTNHIPEDLGVSLSEAARMKMHAIQHNTNSMEWSHYAEDAKKALKKIELELSASPSTKP